MSRKINKGRLFRNSILLLLIIGSITTYLSNRYVKTKGFDNLGDFISTYRTNRALVEDSDPEEIQLFISDKDYKFIENKRQESLDRGIQVNKGDNYVSCKVLYKGDTIKGEIRLKGHMTDHLEGEKWSFRVKTKDEVMGMYRFSLQNPATRNYAYEWVYHELLEYENVIHLKYDFVKLRLNDKDLGVYAIEEHFGQHVLRDNERPPGAILRWNPELYWEQRLDEFDGVYLDEGYSNYSASFPEAYDRGVVSKDDELIETYVKGAQLLEAFRRGEKTTSDVFDIQKMARFHAVIDLVGGYHSLDWSDVKFYYNIETEKIEPVGYESFSVRETVKIAGQRTPEDYNTVGFNYHDRLFSDRVFFEAYIQNLERICDEAYFDGFATKIKAELDQKRGALAEEFAYIKFSFQAYYENIDLIRHNIQLPKPFHVFLDQQTDTSVVVSITPVSDYPIDILALIVDDKDEYAVDTLFTLPPKARNTYAHYFQIQFNHDAKNLKNLKIKARIPGGSTIFEVEVATLPSYKEVPKIDFEMEEPSDSMLVWMNDSVARFEGQSVFLSSRLTIEKGKTLIVNAGQEVIFDTRGVLWVEGEMKVLGTEDYGVQFSSLDGNAGRIVLEGGKFLAISAQFYDLGGDFLVVNEGEVNLQNCQIADIEKGFIQAEKSYITLINSISGGMNSLGDFDQCMLRIKNFDAKNGDMFLSASGSDIEMQASSIQGYNLVADLNYNSDFSSWFSRFDTNGTIGKLNNASSFKTYNSDMGTAECGFYVDTETTLLGKSTYLLYKTNADKIENLEKVNIA